MPSNPFRPLRSVGPLDTPVDYAIDYGDLAFDDHIAGLFVDYDRGPTLGKLLAFWVATVATALLVWAGVIVGAILIVKAAS